MTTPLVSIIVPVYNGAGLAGRCFAALQGQTYPNWECLMVNDGSTDESRAFCQSFAEKDARFVYLEKENGGVSAARNLGLENAKGEYLMFCDQDDWYAPTCLEEALAAQKQNPDAMISWPFVRNEAAFAAAEGRPQQWQSWPFAQVAWRSDWFHTVWNRLFWMEPVKQNHLRFDPALGWKDKLGEDVDFNQKYMDARWPDGSFLVVRGTQPRYFYFPDNPDSVTNNLTAISRHDRTPPESGYCARLLAEMEKTRNAFSGPADRPALTAYLVHYLRCMAFGIYSARALGEALPQGLFKAPALKDLLRLAKENRIYSVYLLPFTLHWGRFSGWLYEQDELQSIWYWRFYEIFYRLFFRGYEK